MGLGGAKYAGANKLTRVNLLAQKAAVKQDFKKTRAHRSTASSRLTSHAAQY
jgi:hypothetical protein